MCVIPGRGLNSRGRTHDVHAVAPAWLAKLPSVQRVQWDVPGDEAKKPVWQSVHAESEALPGAGLLFPAGQTRHEALLEPPASGLYVPAKHGSKVCRTLAEPTAAQ